VYNWRIDGGASRPTRRRFRAEIVYGELRNQILSGRLPVGAPVIEERLAEAFGMSRTPVREALRRLEGDGYLVRGRGGSLHPAMPDVEAMSGLYDVRGVIEELSVRRAAQSGDRTRLESIRAQWRELCEAPESDPARSGPDFVYADEAFHHAIADATGNRELSRILSGVNSRIRTLRIHDFTTPDRIATTIAEHLEIIDTILLGDVEAAAAFMGTHVQRSALIVRQRVTAARDRMGATDG
jgi:DNA-binding GntR family transcriptional regulator